MILKTLKQLNHPMSPTTHSSHIPRLRFSGFFGEWEETRRGKEFTNFPTNSISRDGLNYEEGEIKNIHYGDIHTKFNILFDITKEKVPYINLDIKFNQSNICDKGDIIVADASEDYSDIGKAIEITNIDNQKIVAGLHTLHFRSKDKIFASGFLGYLLKTSSFRRKIQFIAQGAKVLGISVKEFNKIGFIIPEKQEQTKIASFLSAVDEKIQSLTDLRTAWADYKTGIMQQIFSQEIRFPGFTDEWEEKKLGEVCDLKNGYAFESSNYVEGGDYKIITISNVQNGQLNLSSFNTINSLPVDIKNYQILKKGDLLISMTGNVGRVCIVNQNNLLLNQRVGKLEIKKINQIFFYQLIRQNKFVFKMTQLAQGGAQPNIGKFDILGYKLQIPSLPEQEKIANFLSSIDDKIVELDAQIQIAKQWKIGLLQGLFI
ncbi:Type I restriction modification DNA specificity domain protein [candidate division SR1 bacterium Aalborg_AAW-1]|nr:Type I restriction modification DNA specificity domain protein [candidate division SR1 bacterium Aalborg_AAW-1]